MTRRRRSTGRWGRRVVAGAAVMAATVATAARPAALRAQVEPPDSLPDVAPAWEAGLVLAMALPTGAFATYVDVGGGFGLHAARFLDEGRRVAIRLDMGWTVYGHETIRVPLSPTMPFVDVEVTTDNGIGSFTLGPQIVLRRGMISPWVRAAVGVSDFATTTSVNGTGSEQPFASTTNFDDATLALVTGGGLRIALSKDNPHPLVLDLGAVHVWHGETEYLRKGGISADAGGNVRLDTIRSRTNLFAVHLGITLGLR